MPKEWDVSRRKFLGIAGAAPWLGAGVPPVDAGAPAKLAAAGYKVLKPAQAAMLGAIADQIIPADQDPGAREAGAVRYIDNVLAREQSDKLPLYAAGLEGLEQTTELLFGRGFVKLSLDQQTALLKSLEDGSAQGQVWRSVSSREFLALVWRHVLEGFYGPPEHGGNKGYASWKMVGFPPHSGSM